MVTKKKETNSEPEQQPEEVYKPMAVPEPGPLERLAALELRMAVTERWTMRHNKYHFSSEIHP